MSNYIAFRTIRLSTKNHTLDVAFDHCVNGSSGEIRVEQSIKFPQAVHTDMLMLWDKLASHMIRLKGLLGPHSYDPMTELPMEDKLFLADADEHVKVYQVTLKEMKKQLFCILTAKIKSPAGNWVAANTEQIYFNRQDYPFVSELEDIVDKLEQEAYKYVFDGKVSASQQSSLFDGNETQDVVRSTLTPAPLRSSAMVEYEQEDSEASQPLPFGDPDDDPSEGENEDSAPVSVASEVIVEGKSFNLADKAEGQELLNALDSLPYKELQALGGWLTTQGHTVKTVGVSRKTLCTTCRTELESCIEANTRSEGGPDEERVDDTEQEGEDESVGQPITPQVSASYMEAKAADNGDSEEPESPSAL